MRLSGQQVDALNLVVMTLETPAQMVAMLNYLHKLCCYDDTRILWQNAMYRAAILLQCSVPEGSKPLKNDAGQIDSLTALLEVLETPPQIIAILNYLYVLPPSEVRMAWQMVLKYSEALFPELKIADILTPESGQA